MKETSLLGFAKTLCIVFAGIVVLPAFSYEVSLVTSPNRSTFFIPTGEPFNITCKGSGDDTEKFSSLKWLNKEGQVPKRFLVVQEENKAVVLAFTNPKEADSGVYKCVAVYGKRQTLQKSVSIFFQGSKPLFEESFQNITATEDRSLELKCAAVGELPIDYEWYNKDEEKIMENVNSSADISVLTIPRVTLNHTGTYTCLASNTHGASSKIFHLTVIPKYDNDTTNVTSLFRRATVVNVTTRSVKFAIDVYGPAKIIEVKYSENRSASFSYSKEFRYGGNYEIKGLEPAGLYTFRFRTKPSKDDQWSIPYQVVLLPDTPEVIFHSISSGNVKFEWSFKFDDRMRETIDRHEITYYTLQMIGGTSWKRSSCARTIQIPACAGSSYIIAGLSQKVFYEIQLRAHTSAGFSEPYTQKLFLQE